MTDTSYNPGYVINTVAEVSGVSVLEAALGVAALLGGIAGPGAGILGPCGELIHPALNLVIAGAESPRWRRAQELLLEPIEHYQRMFRNASRGVLSERLDHLQFSRTTADHTNRIMDNERRFLESPRGESQGTWPREFEILRRPGFLLRSPSPEGFDVALAETLDRSPLILYLDGQILAQALQTQVSKPWAGLIEQISAAVTGQDRVVPPQDSRAGPGRVELAKASLLITCTADQLGHALTSENPMLQVLRHSLFLGSACALQPRSEVNLQTLEWGYSAYDRAIRGVLSSRRAGQGVRQNPGRDALLAMHAHGIELEEWLHALRSPLKPFFAESLSLPYRLLWSFTTALAARETDEWCVPLACQITWEILEQQRALLESLLMAAEGNQRQKERAVMLAKLGSGPCMFRDLVRRYRVQRREVHEPLLKDLVRDGLVLLSSDGKIELSPAGQEAAAP